MSSRSKKKQSQTVQQETVTQSTPSTSKTTPGRARPPSPTTITRAQEKNELASLNDRLAAYIDRVRFLEGENSRLSKIIQTQEETVTRETSNIKGLYETELADARRLLDETAKERAEITVKLNASQSEAKEFKDKYFSLKAELKDKDRRVLNAESQVSDLQARLSDAISQRKHWENEYNKLRKEYDTLLAQLENSKKQVEAETVQRVDLQNRIQSLKEELDFKANVHAQELNETRTRSTIEIEEVDARYAEDYESRLREAIQEMRAENDAVVHAVKEEAEEYIAKKLADMRAGADRSSGELEFARSELRNTRIRLDELTTEVDKLSAQNLSLEARVRDLVAQLRRQQEEHEQVLNMKDADIRSLKAQIEEQLTEYRDLLSIKIQLDNEIATYNRLLESEETRLNISSSSQSTSPFTQRSVRRTLTGRKRKRGAEEGSFLMQSKSSSSYAQTATAAGPIEIYETDVHGKFVKLYNTSDEEISLAGWKLQHNCGDDETVFKFHRTVVVKPKEYCTVWSSDSETEHNPPVDIVMKGKRFMTGESMKTLLINGDGAEQASRELTRSMQRTQYSLSSAHDEVDSAYEDDTEKKDKCSIM